MPKSSNSANKKQEQSSKKLVKQSQKPGVKKWPGGRPDFQRIDKHKQNKNKPKYISKAAEKATEIERQRQEAKVEKEKRIAEYKKKRLQKAKIFTKRTKKGQPVMKDRMEYLLKQIQDMTGKA